MSKILSPHLLPLLEKCHSLFLQLANAGVANSSHPSEVTWLCVRAQGLCVEGSNGSSEEKTDFINLVLHWAFRRNNTKSFRLEPKQSTQTILKISITTLGAQMATGSDREDPFDLKRGTFEINWSLWSSVFNHENFLLCRTVLTSADFEDWINFAWVHSASGYHSSLF